MLLRVWLALALSWIDSIAVTLFRSPHSGTFLSSGPLNHSGIHTLSILDGDISHVDDHRAKGYLYHEACQTGEGIGSLLRRVRPALALANLYDLKYVCNYLEFKTLSHGALDLGDLFGCHKDGAIGLFADLHSLSDVTWVNTSLWLKSSGEPAPIMSERSFLLHFPEAAQLNDLKMMPEPTVEPNEASHNLRVYKLQGCVDSVEWGQARQMLRKQFHLVRNMDPQRRVPSAWKFHDGQAPWRIAVHIRRGDLPRKVQTDVTHFARVLEDVIYVRLPALNVSRRSLRIVVLAEDSDASPYQALTELGARLFLTDTNSSAYERLVRDLDHLATANIQILSDSTFSILGAALQHHGGIALRVGGRDRASIGDLPNVFEVGHNGVSPAGIDWAVLVH